MSPVIVTADAGPTTLSQPAHPAPAQVRIERLILHGLSNRAEGIQLVDDPVVLTGESERFFALHIESAMTRAEWRARFADPAGDIASLCRQLLSGHEDFVAASRRLALRLHEQMRPRTIAPGDFVAAVYTSGDGQRHVALLKLDPDQRLARTFTSSGGRTRVSITAAQNLLPETRNLQKCALMTAADTASGFDVTLLDNQAGPRTDGVAAFFYRGFLAAELDPSPRRRTREFLRCCDAWLAGYRDTLPPADVTTFYAVRREYLCFDELDICRFTMAALPAYPDLARKLEEHLLTALAPTSGGALATASLISVDSAIATPVVSRVTLELDGGARLTVPADRFAELVHIEPERTAENKVRIVIESLTLKEVSDR